MGVRIRASRKDKAPSVRIKNKNGSFSLGSMAAEGILLGPPIASSEL
jgi:hypothetical protein